MNIPDNVCVDEKVSIFNVKNRYKIYNETSAEHILTCVENGSFLVKAFKLFGFRNITPLHITVSFENNILFEIKRTFWDSIRIWSQLKVFENDGSLLGVIDEHSKTNPELRIYNNNEQLVLKAVSENLFWRHHNYTFKRKGQTIAKMNKQWKDRILTEMFTSADKYRIEFHPEHGDSQRLKKLTLATCLSIDLLYKEKGGSKGLLGILSS